MPYFRYVAVDRQGNRVEGELEAASAGEVQQRLGEGGLHSIQVTPGDRDSAVHDRGSATEGVQVAQLIGDVSQAGFPLGAGLRALADEMPQKRLAARLRKIADKVESGTSVEAAVEDPALRLPGYLQGILAASVRSGRFGVVLQEILEHQLLIQDLRARLWQVLSYPFLLLILMAAWFALVLLWLVPDFAQIYDDFDTTLPRITVLLTSMSRHGVAIVLGLFILAILILNFGWVANRSTLAFRTLLEMPLLGPLVRNWRVVEFTSFLAALVRQSIALPEALRLTAAGMRNKAVAQAAERAAGTVAEGASLSRALGADPIFPPGLIALVQWGETNSNLPGALDTATEMFLARSRPRQLLLTAVLPVLAFLMLGAGVLFVLIALFAPLVGMIQMLSCLVPILGAVPSERRLLERFIRVIAALMAVSLVVLPLLYFDLPYAIAVAVIALVILVMLLEQTAKMHAEDLLTVLALATERQVPLSNTAHAISQERYGLATFRVRKFAAMLEDGWPLHAAIAECPGALPPYSYAAAHVGEQLLALGPALRVVMRRQSLWPITHSVTSQLFYVMSMLFALVSVGTFLMIMIVPQFVVIFDDFETALPAMTVVAINVSSFLAWSAGFLAILGLLAFAVVVYAGFAYIGWIQPSLGILDFTARGMDRAIILRFLALAIERDRPLDGTMAVLADCYPNRWVRRKIWQAAERMSTGQPWYEALDAEGLLGRGDAALLEAGQRARAAAWSARQVADTQERRVVYRMQAITTAAFPFVVILVGLAVAFFIIAFFLPLVALITRLSG